MRIFVHSSKEYSDLCLTRELRPIVLKPGNDRGPSGFGWGRCRLVHKLDEIEVWENIARWRINVHPAYPFRVGSLKLRHLYLPVQERLGERKGGFTRSV
jgi:hypothetical protein